MATLANLDVNLFARTKKFDAPIKKSEGVFSRFTKTVGGFGRGGAAKFAAGAGVVVGAIGGLVGAAVAMKKVNEQFESIDRIGKFSDEVGASVGEMQAMRLQANLTGTSVETLEKGIQRYTRRLGEARQGMGEGLKALNNFGLSADELSRLPLSEAMGKISDKINEQETAADRAALAYGLFGRQGQELMTFFAGGSTGIQAARDDIQSLGAELTRFDAANVEMANDAFTRMEVATTALWQSIAVEAAPVLTAVVEMFIDGSKQAGGFGSIVETSFLILTEGIKFSLNAWDFFIGAIDLARAGIVGFIGLAISGLAQIEKALIAVGGRKFDFGIQGLATEINKEAKKFATDGVMKVNAALAGSAGNAFQNRLDEIKNRAQTIADSADERLAPPPEPKPVDWQAVGQDFWSKFNDELANQAELFTGFGVEKEPPGEKPTVAAVTRGSVAAVSAANRARGKEDAVTKEIKKSHIEEARILNDQNAHLGSIVDELKKGWVGKVIPI